MTVISIQGHMVTRKSEICALDLAKFPVSPDVVCMVEKHVCWNLYLVRMKWLVFERDNLVGGFVYIRARADTHTRAPAHTQTHTRARIYLLALRCYGWAFLALEWHGPSFTVAVSWGSLNVFDSRLWKGGVVLMGEYGSFEQFFLLSYWHDSTVILTAVFRSWGHALTTTPFLRSVDKQKEQRYFEKNSKYLQKPSICLTTELVLLQLLTDFTHLSSPFSLLIIVKICFTVMALTTTFI